MNLEELKDLLENTDNKFKILSDSNILSKYNITEAELVDLIRQFLTDEQKEQLFEYEYFKNLSSLVKTYIIQCIYNNEIKLRVLENSEINVNIESFYLEAIITSLEDDYKIQLLQKPNFFKNHNISSMGIYEIIESLSEDNKQKLLYNKDFIKNKLLLGDSYIQMILQNLENDDIKAEMIKIYKLDALSNILILQKFADENIIDILLENKYNFEEFEDKNNEEICLITMLLVELDNNSLINFINNNKNFLIRKGIKPFNITRLFTKNKQLDFISKLENIDLTISEKKCILATLENAVKREIDISKFPKDYETAIEHKIDNNQMHFSFGKIIPNLNGDLKRYFELDEIICINPTNIPNKHKFLELCEICPKMQIYDDMQYGLSTVAEYQDAEMWIESILEKIDENWSDIQKLAFIDNAIGKKISYSPDFNTEISNERDARALWKIISSGYGVCNGISQIEKYILDKIGIESEIVQSASHAFLKIKNIELPTKNSGTIKGDTIVDPTWNLVAHRYDGMPENFCKSYSEIRKHDIMEDGTDTECHKNDKYLYSATLNLDKENLKNIFATIGLADKNGDFPIKKLISESEAIDLFNFPEEESLKKQLFLLENYYPEFAICNNSTAFILQNIILNKKNLKFKRCIVNRVYERKDKNKIPILYIYVDLPQAGKKFYFADRNKKQFIELPQKEFEEKFECYQMDIENYDGHRPWEYIEKTEDLENLATSSGRLVASEGDER